MKREAMLATLLCAVGACSDLDPTAPPPALAPPAMAVVIEGEGDMTFHESSGCVLTDVVTCSYHVLGSRPYTRYRVDVDGYYERLYQCVHQKTGKAAPKAVPQAYRVWSNNYYEVYFDWSGDYLSDDDVEVGPPSWKPDFCSGNKGPYTVMEWLTEYYPIAWEIWANNETESGDWISLYYNFRR